MREHSGMQLNMFQTLRTDLNGSFTTRISHLEMENSKLAGEVSRWEEEANVQSTAFLHANEVLEQLRCEICEVQKSREHLTRENATLCLQVERLKKMMQCYETEVKRASLPLQKLRQMKPHHDEA